MTPLPPPFDEVWFQLIVGLCVGLALGSFITDAVLSVIATKNFLS